MSQHWNTPAWIVDLAREAMGGPIGLDPFSNTGSLTGAAVHCFGPPDGPDGFKVPWGVVGGRRVFFNPPWRKSGQAVRKAAAEWEDWKSIDIQIIGLLPCSMNARHWPLVEQAAARCYLAKRPNFLEEGEIKKGNPKDVAIVYWGARPHRFADVFRDAGRCHFGRAV